MGKCSKCGKKILYNKYRVVRGKIYCPDCKPTQVKRKTNVKRYRKIVTPNKKARKALKGQGIDFTALDNK